MGNARLAYYPYTSVPFLSSSTTSHSSRSSGRLICTFSGKNLCRATCVVIRDNIVRLCKVTSAGPASRMSHTASPHISQKLVWRCTYLSLGSASTRFCKIPHRRVCVSSAEEHTIAILAVSAVSMSPSVRQSRSRASNPQASSFSSGQRSWVKVTATVVRGWPLVRVPSVIAASMPLLSEM